MLENLLHYYCHIEMSSLASLNHRASWIHAASDYLGVGVVANIRNRSKWLEMCLRQEFPSKMHQCVNYSTCSSVLRHLRIFNRLLTSTFTGASSVQKGGMKPNPFALRVLKCPSFKRSFVYRLINYLFNSGYRLVFSRESTISVSSRTWIGCTFVGAPPFRSR